MKKRVFAFALAVVFASLSFGTTSKAAEVNPIVQQLNQATGNYIGYDMTQADKVKVLTATYAASKTATSYTVHWGTEDRPLNWNKYGKEVATTSTGTYETYFYVDGDDAANTRTTTGSAPVGYTFYLSGVCYADGELNNGTWENSKEEFLNETLGQRNNAWSIDKAIDRGAFSIEYLAQNSTYQEINGVPYLVFTCHPTMDMLNAMNGYVLDAGEAHLQNESTLTISFPLNNYGAFTVDMKLMTKSSPKDSICANGKYLYTFTYGNSNVNCTVLPALPANYLPITQWNVQEAPAPDAYVAGGFI